VKGRAGRRLYVPLQIGPKYDAMVGYRALARSVIRMAMLDASSPRGWLREDAAEFLLHRTDDHTRLWFDLAGVEMDVIRQTWRSMGFAGRWRRPSTYGLRVSHRRVDRGAD
jgi:hypothetical protein